MKEKNNPLYYGSVVAAALVVALGGWLLSRAPGAGLRPSSLPIPSLTRKTVPALGAQDLSFIASWMTFDYLNKTFGLPADYLKTSLLITDSRYPILTINRYARWRHISADSATTAVSSAIAAYLQRR